MRAYIPQLLHVNLTRWQSLPIRKIPPYSVIRICQVILDKRARGQVSFYAKRSDFCLHRFMGLIIADPSEQLRLKHTLLLVKSTIQEAIIIGRSIFFIRLQSRVEVVRG